MGSSECCCFIKWLCCCFNAADQNPPASFENKVSNLPAPFESKVSNAATDQIISSPFTEEETTLEHLDKVLADIKGQLDRLERAADHSSRISLSWVNYKGQITSFMQTLPTSFTSEVAETSKTLLMQLLGGLGGLHWTAIGFSLIAWSLETMDTSAQNWKDCLQLLRTIVSLLENTRKIWQASPEDDDLKVLQDSVEIAFQCAIICSSMMQGGGPKHRLLRLLKASSIQASIDNLKRDLDRAFEQIRTHIEVVRFVEAPRLQRQYTYTHIDGIVGGDEVRKKAMAHLNRDGSQLVAVFLQGMGGIGKSTFGMAIFSEFQKKISPQGMSQYRCCCVELPLGIAKEKGLQKFQKQILDKLCRHGTPEISSLKDGVLMLKKELEKLREPVFLYLDNVLDPMKEEHWLPEAQSFPKGSRILVTTRHEHVCKALARRLKIWDYKCIKVEKLDEQQSKELLWRQLQQDDSQHAWHSPNAEMEMLEREVLELCDGLPLALTVVGRYIANSEDGPRVAKVWKGAIEAMRRAESLDGDAEDELYSRMRVSIDLLDSEIRKAFLDVVAYAVGWPWSTAERLVSTRRLEVLCQRALVEQTSLGSNVEVQDVLKTMGLRLVADDKEEIRIRGQADFDDTTSRNALEKVVGLMDVMVEAEQLQQMPRLRCLRNVKIEGDCKRGAKLRHLLVCEMSGDTARPFDVSACIALKELSWFRAAANVGDLEVPLKALEWMKVSQQLEMLTIQGWVGLVNVDAIVCLHSLKGLHIRNCGSLQSLSEGVASWTGLTSLQLSGCRNLQSLPEGVASWRGLRSLQLSGCRSLQSLPEGAASWTDLTSLDLSGCGSLQSLPKGAASWQSLMSLDLSRSGSLQSLSEGAASWVGLTSLDLCGCDRLQSLPEGVASWTGLTSLDLSECGSLESLPKGVACWTGLTSLDLSLCGSLRSLPEGVASWTGLTSLDLSWCGSLKALPEGVASWTGLTSLQMFGCRSLQSLPEGVASWSGLRSLDLCGCGSLQSLPEGVASWTGLRSLDLFGCGSLQSLPEGVASWTGLTSLDLSWCSSLQSLPVGVASWKGLMSLQLSGCRSLQSLLGAAAS